MNFSKHLIKVTIILIFLATFWLQLFVKGWNRNRVIEWDTMEYYSYLPATFIYNDLSLEFTKENPEFFSSRFWPHTASNGKLVLKMSSGMAIVYSPFFAIAHLLAKPLGYEPDGFTTPYRMAISFGALVYLAIGLILLSRFLQKGFKPLAVSITLLLVALATNLWYYSTVEPGMSHVYNFTLFVIFITLTDKWLQKPNVKLSIALGLLSGLISLIRPTNALIGILILLWGVSNLSTLKIRVQYLLKNWTNIVVIALFAIAVWIPQMVYWKMQTGQLFYYSYSDQGFFFLSPHIIDGLFSFRKGWFVYTPLMIFAIAGIFLLPRYLKNAALAVPAFTILNVYVIFSWWSWWYGGSYGARPLIDSYALMAIPLAAFIEHSLKWRNALKVPIFVLFTLLTVHGIFQTLQYYYGAIHWDSMTREAYFDSFGRLKASSNFKYLITEPDYESALKGDDEREKIKKTSNHPAILMQSDGSDIMFILENIRGNAGTEYIEIFKDSLVNQQKPLVIKAQIVADEDGLPESLLLAVSVHDYSEKVLLYKDMDLFIMQKTNDVMYWETTIDCCFSEPVVLKIYFWSRSRDEFRIKSVKTLITGF